MQLLYYCLFILQDKKMLKEEKLKQEEKYMWAVVDGVKEKVWLGILSSFSLYIGRADDIECEDIIKY